MPGDLSHATKQYTRSLLDACRAEGIEKPTYDHVKAKGYSFSLSTFGKVVRLWDKENGIVRKVATCQQALRYHAAIKELDGVEDLEERKRLVREMSMREMRHAYGSQARRAK